MKRITTDQLLLALMDRWFSADGHRMPMNIQCQSLEFIERAVLRREAGETVFVPPVVPVVVTGKHGESFLDWDGSFNE